MRSYKILRPIHQVNRLGGAGQGGVEPAVILLVPAVFRHESLVNEYVFPLAALCLVAGYGVGLFDLQCIEMRIVTQLFHLLLPVGNIGIILHHAVEQTVTLLAGE